MSYSKKVIDHFENPRNVGTLDKDNSNVGTGLVGSPACLVGDTLVAVPRNKDVISIKQLSELKKNTSVYSYSDDDGVVISNGYLPRLTKESAECVKLILDNGSFLECTTDHLIRTRSDIANRWVKAADSKNIRLMPFTRSFEKGMLKQEIFSSSPKVIEVIPAGRRDVYCLTVEPLSNFSIITKVSDSEHKGIFVHNCGDVMRLQIKVNDDGIIEDAKYKTFGCGSAIASSSLVTEWLKGKTLQEAESIKNIDIVDELNLPPVKIHCSVLAEDAIKSAINNYKNKQKALGLLESKNE
jgi:nitrogen fixation NifU-like protein